MSIQLRVDPKDLIEKSAQVSEQIKKIKADYQEIETRMKNSKSYWNGLASDKARKEFEEVNKDFVNAIQRLEEHPDDLLKMAGVYKETEKKLIESNKKLKTDIIV